MTFAESGITLHPALPVLLSFVLTLVMSTGGVTGAFVLLPFQVSVLGYTAAGVTPTNHLFNVVAIPSGVYRYVREGRMVWPLALVLVVGTAPGVVLGSLARIHLLPDPRGFKLFMGLVLLLIGTRLLYKALLAGAGTTADSGSGSPSPHGRGGPGERADFRVHTLRFGIRRLEYEFNGAEYSVPVWLLLGLSLVVGVIGGAYGVGGGAILAPLLISVFRLPVHTTAGATLLGTWTSSTIGVGFFAVLAASQDEPGLSPDWMLGLLFGVGGILGMYTGAALQRRLQAQWIESVLGIGVTALALAYVIGYFL